MYNKYTYLVYFVNHNYVQKKCWILISVMLFSGVLIAFLTIFASRGESGHQTRGDMLLNQSQTDSIAFRFESKNVVAGSNVL